MRVGLSVFTGRSCSRDRGGWEERRERRKEGEGGSSKEAAPQPDSPPCTHLDLKQLPTSTPSQMSSSGGQLNSPIAKGLEEEVVLVGGKPILCDQQTDLT